MFCCVVCLLLCCVGIFNASHSKFTCCDYTRRYHSITWTPSTRPIYLPSTLPPWVSPKTSAPSMQANLLRTTFRRRYSPWFRSGRAWDHRRRDAYTLVDLPSTLLPRVSLRKIGPSTQATLLRTIFRRRYSPRFRSSRCLTINAWLSTPASSVDATPTDFAQEEWSIDANMLRTIFRRRYSPWFRSGNLETKNLRPPRCLRRLLRHLCRRRRLVIAVLLILVIVVVKTGVVSIATACTIVLLLTRTFFLHSFGVGGTGGSP